MLAAALTPLSVRAALAHCVKEEEGVDAVEIVLKVENEWHQLHPPLCPSGPLPHPSHHPPPPIHMHCTARSQLQGERHGMPPPGPARHPLPFPPGTRHSAPTLLPAPTPPTPVPLTHCALPAPRCSPPGTAPSPARPQWWANLAAAESPVCGGGTGGGSSTDCRWNTCKCVGRYACVAGTSPW